MVRPLRHLVAAGHRGYPVRDLHGRSHMPPRGSAAGCGHHRSPHASYRPAGRVRALSFVPDDHLAAGAQTRSGVDAG